MTDFNSMTVYVLRIAYSRVPTRYGSRACAYSVRQNSSHSKSAAILQMKVPGSSQSYITVMRYACTAQ